METVKITPNLKLIQLGHGVLGCIGLFLVAAHLIAYLNGELPDLWYLHLTIGLAVMIVSFARVMGFYKIRYPYLTISDQELSLEGIPWPITIKIDRLQHLIFQKYTIEAKYRSSGSKETIKIPLLLRREKNLTRLQNELQGRCQKAGVEYIGESKLQHDSP